MGMLEAWHEGGFQVQPFPLLNVDQGEECSAGGEAGQRGVPDSLGETERRLETRLREH